MRKRETTDAGADDDDGGIWGWSHIVVFEDLASN